MRSPAASRVAASSVSSLGGYDVLRANSQAARCGRAVVTYRLRSPTRCAWFSVATRREPSSSRIWMVVVGASEDTYNYGILGHFANNNATLQISCDDLNHSC